MSYHAWTYFEGKLIAAPNLTKLPDIDRDEYSLAKVHIREYLGYVWVSLSDGPPSFEEGVMGAIEERLGRVHAIVGYDVANLSPGRRIKYYRRLRGPGPDSKCQRGEQQRRHGLGGAAVETNKTLTLANAASPPWDQGSTRRSGYWLRASSTSALSTTDSGNCGGRHSD